MAHFDFDVSHLYESVADQGTALIRVKTGDEPVKVIMVIKEAGETFIKSYAGTSYTDGGTSLNINKRNQEYDESPHFSAYHSPTVDQTGEVADRGFITGSGEGVDQQGGEGGTNDPLIWSPNSEHLVEATNRAGQDRNIFIKVLFSEH